MFARGGSWGKMFFRKEKRERVAFCLAKWFDKVERDKLHCLTDIGVAFERLGLDDKSWRKYGNLANWRIYTRICM